MKRKFNKIFGVGLTLTLLVSLIVAALPVSAGTLSLGSDTVVPYVFPFKTALYSDVHDIAVNGSTIYLTTEDGDVGAIKQLLKSTDSGGAWSDLATSTDYPTGATILLVAVAPDDADVVAIVTSDNTVFLSTNGGSSWSALGNPRTDDAAVISDIDISPMTGGYYYIAAGGTDGSDAELYTIKLAMAETWTARVGAGFTSGMSQINAVKFSPNFDIDKIITTVSGNATNAYFQMFRAESGAYTWNGNITFATGWGTGATAGVRVTASLASGGVGAITTSLVSASIALPASYLGNDEAERIAFVSIAGGGTDEGGVTRLSDTYLTAVGTWSASLLGAIHSLAYNDETLIAGSYDNNSVYRVLDPMAVLPRAERLNNFKQPSGVSRTVVAWAGSKVVAGTSGDESAFAVSTDDGYAFNDISLIDSMIMASSYTTDMAISADGNTLYVVTYVGDDVNVWLREYGISWTRVLSLRNEGATDLILRLAPEDASVLYLVNRDTADVWVTTDSGKTRWKEADVYKLSSIQDFAVESADVAYAIDTSGATKTSNAGASWGSVQPLKIAGYMVTVASNGDVLVGGSDGYIAWSKDGGASFSKLPMSLGAIYTGNVQVLPDADYESNGIVYATNGRSGGSQTIYRGTLSTALPITTSRGPTLPTTTGNETAFSYYGLAQSDGIVYALAANTTSIYVYRALNLRDATSSATALWSSYSTSGNATAVPQGLKMSAGPKVWAVNVAVGGFVKNVTDPIALEGPASLAPEDEFLVPVNPASGNAYDVTFSFERYSSSYVNEFQLQIATDADFNAIIYDQTLTGITTNTISVVLGPSGGEAYGVNLAASFMPTTTYHWRVRVGADGPALSPWADTRSFTIGELEAGVTVTIETPEVTAPAAAAAVTIAPAAGAMDVSLQPTFVWPVAEGATGYEIMVSEYADFSILEWSHTTAQNFYPADDAFAYGTTYYWRARASEPEQGAWTNGIFSTMAKPEPVEPLVITVTEPAPPAEVVTVEIEKAAAIPSYLLWTVIAVGAVLVIALIVLIVRTRRIA